MTELELMPNLEHLHIVQNKGSKRQYLTAIPERKTDTQDDLDTRAEKTAEHLERQFGGFMEIRTTAEVVASKVNYPRDQKGAIRFKMSEFA